MNDRPTLQNDAMAETHYVKAAEAYMDALETRITELEGALREWLTDIDEGIPIMTLVDKTQALLATFIKEQTNE